MSDQNGVQSYEMKTVFIIVFNKMCFKYVDNYVSSMFILSTVHTLAKPAHKNSVTAM